MFNEVNGDVANNVTENGNLSANKIPEVKRKESNQGRKYYIRNFFKELK